MSTKTLTILVIAQNPEDRLIYKRSLGGRLAGYRFVECENGNQGLETLTVFPFDCILLDFELPDMDGIGVIKEIRHLESHAFIPIVVLTGAGNKDAAAQALKSGATACLCKGQFDGVDLKQVVQDAVAKRDPDSSGEDDTPDNRINDIRELTGEICQALSRPLQIINGQAEIRRRLYAKSYDQAELMQKILAQTQRLEGLSRKLKSLTRCEVKEFPGNLESGDVTKPNRPSKFH